MDKTILIKTNASTLPSIVERTDATIIDGSLKNLFCTYLGYELVDGLYDNNNIPYYRLLRPAQILLDFEKVKSESFNELFYEWQGILEYLFINGIPNNAQSSLVFKFHIPQGMTDWLLECDDSSYYNIGVKICQMPNISITIDNEQYNEITSYFVQRIKQEIDNNYNQLNIVFCNNNINESSSIIKILGEKLSFDTNILSHLIRIMSFSVWKELQFESFKDCCHIEKVVYYTGNNNGSCVDTNNKIQFVDYGENTDFRIRFYIKVLRPCNMRYDLQLHICSIPPHSIWLKTINQAISVNTSKDAVVERDFVIDFPYCNCDYKCVLFANEESINEISIRCDYYLDWLDDDHGYSDYDDPGPFLRGGALSGG